ncbi:MAG: class I tRNA ligase family protein, partial [Thiothrix sp.]|nr:class I tRNA ligase family protein [Thiothrix sp.]
GWFHSSLLTGVAMDGCAPYRSVLTHGFTVDGKGQKMSKSLGNVIAPQEVMDRLGADILRLWVASADYSREMTVSDEILKRTADGYRRMRNTARFLLANLSDFDPATDQVAPADMLPLDRWAVHQAAQVQKKVIQAYERYQFHLVVQEVQRFCSVDMGSLFLDIIKDRQYTMQADSRGRRSAQTAACHILQAMLRWLYPVMSFTMEEVLRHLPGQHDDSVLFMTWYDGLFELDAQSPLSDRDWEQVFEVREAISKQLETLRVEGRIGSGLDAGVQLYLSGDSGGVRALKQLGDELKFVFITSAVTLHEAAAPAAALPVMAGVQALVEPLDTAKCVRCWHHAADVDSHADYPGLCGRCVENVAGKGEVRQYA